MPWQWFARRIALVTWLGDKDPDLLVKQEELSGTAANVAGIMRWLDMQSKQ